MSLLGIYNARCCQMKTNALLNRCVEDPRQKPSGMTLHLIPPHPAFGHPLHFSFVKFVLLFSVVETIADCEIAVIVRNIRTTIRGCFC